MVSVRPVAAARLLPAGIGIVGIGVLVALATNLGLTVLSPAKLAFLLGGFALLIPTMVVKDPKAYWLFLLVLSIPFDISKLLSTWLVDPQALVDAYGQPASETTSVELYLTDVALIVMVLLWLAQVCMRRERLYFPRIGYFFVCYLAWSLLVSMVNAPSFYLSSFELCRQILYLLLFVYLINNIRTRGQVRSVVLAVFLGLTISAASVIAFFEMGIGTETAIFASLHDAPAAGERSSGSKNDPGAVDLTFHGNTRRFPGASDAGGSQIKRSQGMFRHPAIPASLCGLVLPLVLAYLVAAGTNRQRILLLSVLVLGITALALTFSRAGAIGFTVGTIVFFCVAGWSGLIGRRTLTRGIVISAIAVLFSVPFLLTYFGARPGSFLMRFYLFEASLHGYSEHPFLGVGLNNGTAAMKSGRQALLEIGIPMPPTESADSLYLAVLTEVGPLGFFFFFGFFGKIVMIALRALGGAAAELQPLLVGMLAGMASLVTQNLADDTLGGHAISGTLWVFVALTVAVARHTQAEAQSFRVGHAAAIGPTLRRSEPSHAMAGSDH